MSTTLSVLATEESTYVINCEFRGVDDTLVTPTSVKWTLTDLSGTVINGRSQVAIAGGLLDTDLDIVLKGDDLAVSTVGNNAVRVLTVEALYDETIDGVAYTDLPLNGATQFTIENLIAI